MSRYLSQTSLFRHHDKCISVVMKTTIFSAAPPPSLSTNLLVPPESLVDLILSGRAVLLVPSVDELLLPLLATSEVVGVESLEGR